MVSESNYFSNSQPDQKIKNVIPSFTKTMPPTIFLRIA